MKPAITYLIGLLTMLSCTTSQNPLLVEWNTPFGVPPFDQITESHFMPAFQAAIKEHDREIESITRNADPAGFEKSVAALDYSGKKLQRINLLFNNLQSAHTNAKLQDLARELAPILSKHDDDIMLNAELFARIKHVYDHQAERQFTPEQQRLLEKTFNSFVRNGANLTAEQKEELRTINEKLALLSLKFGDNVLAETNDFKLIISDPVELEGLPQWLIEQAADDAQTAGQPGKWAFTLHKSSWIPFLQYSPRRDLRGKLYKAWMHLGDNNNDFDNKQILAEIASLRLRRANLLGFATHADYVLEVNMAKTPAQVYALLHELWTPALQRARMELGDIKAEIRELGDKVQPASWDWWYYAEKLRQKKFDLSDDVLKPYFKLDNVVQGLFGVARNLYGLQFVPLTDLPVYQNDVIAYEVKEADGAHVCVLYMDFFPRPSKRSGAWMTKYRGQYRENDAKITPIISIVMNFSKPTADTPSLLTLDEVLTLFHEFGHALHGMLSDCTYPKLAGTSVARDFVELPSQIMEKWALTPEVLKTYAVHYQTNTPIPDDLIEKINKSNQFNQGFITVEYLAAALLDMNYHVRTDTALIADVNTFEANVMSGIGLIPEIIPRYRSTYFQHIFSGGYSAGYYSYIWAEVLDADAFEAFKETSLFDPETAISFRRNILERGDTEDPMVLYHRFRGRDPEITPLLKDRGLI
ncbi:MAG: M3 family peptidase [Calditrichaeota bacterium]|nr:MAG: M3 family peptidase [Calditrichota bacterium]